MKGREGSQALKDRVERGCEKLPSSSRRGHTQPQPWSARKTQCRVSASSCFHPSGHGLERMVRVRVCVLSGHWLALGPWRPPPAHSQRSPWFLREGEVRPCTECRGRTALGPRGPTLPFQEGEACNCSRKAWSGALPKRSVPSQASPLLLSLFWCPHQTA